MTAADDNWPIKTVPGDKQPITTAAGDKFVFSVIPVLHVCMYQKGIIYTCRIFLLAENLPEIAGPEVIKLLLCSTQLSKKFQLLLKTRIWTNKEVSCFKSLRWCIYHAIKC